ncbi:GAF and ANTAR domain-containing protein [Arthrobacter sp. CAN_C5]|uniref:GAF and ANTAR domain-containing protein n=1 Tax=Arthrobacter sp. CAN_C5 TaxID=2760706 RepID=UPI0037BFCABE|nr:GAF domain-containing protein [Arthrobacter sp. CAN_C5]
MLRRHRAVTVASSGDRAQRIDEVQYGFDDGPCLTAARDQITVVVPEMRAEKRWLGYPAVLVAEGIGSVVSVPFVMEGNTKAALNVYSGESGHFSSAVIDLIEEHVRDASKALQLAVKVAQQVDTAEHLKAALESRTVIDLALGITMGRTGCTQDEAIQRLKSISRQQNMKLRALATQIVVANGGTTSAHFVM